LVASTSRSRGRTSVVRAKIVADHRVAVFAWMPVARVRLSIRDCLCYDSLFADAFWMLGKIVQLVTPALLDLPGWLGMSSLVRHGLSECVGVTQGGHKVSPISNYTVMHPRYSPESIGHLSQIATCLVYAANPAHFIYCGHSTAYDLSDRSRYAEAVMEACEHTLHCMMSSTVNIFIRVVEFRINSIYIPTIPEWIRTGTASNGSSSTRIRTSSTLNRYNSNQLAHRSTTTHRQCSRLPTNLNLPSRVDRSHRTKV
jgi:hypothetical protein